MDFSDPSMVELARNLLNDGEAWIQMTPMGGSKMDWVVDFITDEMKAEGLSVIVGEPEPGGVHLNGSPFVFLHVQRIHHGISDTTP